MAPRTRPGALGKRRSMSQEASACQEYQEDPRTPPFKVAQGIRILLSSRATVFKGGVQGSSLDSVTRELHET